MGIQISGGKNKKKHYSINGAEIVGYPYGKYKIEVLLHIIFLKN